MTCDSDEFEVQPKEAQSESGESEDFRCFLKMAEEGREPLAAVMSFMIAERPFRALRVICSGNNWQKVVSALAVVFHLSDYSMSLISIGALKARGYQLLRNLVRNCVADLNRAGYKLPEGYPRLAERLFESQGLQAP